MNRHILLVVAATLALLTTGAAQGPGWAIACGDGRVDLVIDHFDVPWGVCCTPDPSIPKLAPVTIAGCSGNAMAVPYDLRNKAPDGQSWIVVDRTFNPALNLSAYTHVRVAMRGEKLTSHETVDVKLKNGPNGIFTVSLRSMTDLPVWRPIYLDLREFVRTGATLDLTNITGLEVGIARCDACEVWDNPAIGQPDDHQGTLFLDEFAMVNLAPGGTHRVVQNAVETFTPNAAVRSGAANAILARVATTPPGQRLVPAWFPETSPNFNIYAQAEALLVFVYEWERTGNTAFRDAAINLAAGLITLQITEGHIQHGAWFTAHFVENLALRPPDRALPRPSDTVSAVRCNGNEEMIADPGNGQPTSANIDACQWAGNIGWTLIALGKLRRSGIYPDAAALQTAIDRAAAWIIRQPSERASGQKQYPNLVTLGVEGNLSAYFGLRAAGKPAEAAALGNAIFLFAWDSVQRRMRPGVRPEDAATAIDVSGSWGAVFLRSIGRPQEALESQGYSASVLRARSFDNGMDGYGDIAGPYTPAVEFAAQAVAAGIKDAALIEQLYALQIPPGSADAGAFRGARDAWYGGPLSPWVTTMPGVSPTAWMYFASWLDPLAANVSFTDDALVGSASTVKAAHLLELRARIDVVRARYGRPPFSYAAGVTVGMPILARHVQDLRDALDDVYNVNAGHSPPRPDWIDPGLPPSTMVKTAHIDQIRLALMALE